MQNALYYLITVLIWGSTWFAIKFQLGFVSPELSIAYRYTLAAAILFIFTAIRRLPMRFSLTQHVLLATQGFLLFSITYYLVYTGEIYLTSGMVALLFTFFPIANILFGALFLRAPIRARVVIGSLLGILGVAFIFGPDLSSIDLSGGIGLGITLVLISVITASLGNILATRNQRHGLPVIQSNAYGMAYGAAFMILFALFNQSPFVFEFSLSYILSLLYLALFGSVIAFGTYMTLLGRIGPDRAAYVTVLFPVIALALSTIFEGLTWSPPQLAGVGLVLIGNVVVLTKIRFGRWGIPKTPKPQI
ncbi:MAG: DMT family transporter [Anaerolineae bacterium]|nr:DMT family transporter [Anaerolineae bacterium]